MNHLTTTHRTKLANWAKFLWHDHGQAPKREFEARLRPETGRIPQAGWLDIAKAAIEEAVGWRRRAETAETTIAELRSVLAKFDGDRSKIG